MKRVKLSFIAVTLLFNGFIFLASQSAFSKDESLPTRKGILGKYQGIDICHCPDSLENCWCNPGN